MQSHGLFAIAKLLVYFVVWLASLSFLTPVRSLYITYVLTCACVAETTYLGCPAELQVDLEIAVVVEAVDEQRR